MNEQPTVEIYSATLLAGEKHTSPTAEYRVRYRTGGRGSKTIVVPWSTLSQYRAFRDRISRFERREIRDSFYDANPQEWLGDFDSREDAEAGGSLFWQVLRSQAAETSSLDLAVIQSRLREAATIVYHRTPDEPGIVPAEGGDGNDLSV